MRPHQLNTGDLAASDDNLPWLGWFLTTLAAVALLLIGAFGGMFIRQIRHDDRVRNLIAAIRSLADELHSTKLELQAEIAHRNEELELTVALGVDLAKAKEELEGCQRDATVIQEQFENGDRPPEPLPIESIETWPVPVPVPEAVPSPKTSPASADRCQCYCCKIKHHCGCCGCCLTRKGVR